MALGPLVGSVGIIAAVALLLSRETGYQRPERFVIVTSPGTRNVLWAPLPKFHDLTLKDRPIPDAQILIDGAASKCSGWACIETSNHGLEEPAGLALYQKAGGKAWLYVSDPKVGFLYRYEVTSTWRNTLEAGPQELVASNLKDAAYWLAVDGFGNIFYTDAEAGTVSMIKAEDVSKSVPQGRTVLSSEKMEKVAGPAGIATDSTALYWANLKGDRSTGTLVQARVEGSGNHSASILAGNQDMYQAVVKDVCLAGDNVFFTGDGQSLFAVKADGSSDVTEVAKLEQPKGCTFDQETTLFVADQGSNGIYSLPANMNQLRRASHVDKVASVRGPHQIAMFFGAGLRWIEGA
ncbi:Protein kinase domain-containing protein [Durusdinium trenchii]|uniref:Protein kinase domain-containing protein n=1 Tax=Durusdinium trenchii TaxID=1381693 RepID=A0ABP0KPZ8_9DINO